MKYFLVAIFSILILFIFLFCPMSSKQEVEYLRIHIRANSNSVIDQNVKYKVKDQIVDVLIPYLSEAKTFEQAKEVIEKNFVLIEKTANQVLKEDGFSYGSKASIKNEYFPTRTYDNLTLKEGYYDALIVELGNAEGNNWWCIVFPAFCFTKSQNIDKIEYISLIWEIIKSVT